MPVTPNPLLDLAPGVGQVGSMVRYRVLDRYLNRGGDIHPLKVCTIKATTGANIKRTLSGFMLNEPDLRAINPFSDRIQPVWVLEDGTEWECGVFVFTDAARARGSYVSTLATTMADQDWVLNLEMSQGWQINPGGSIVGGILDLLDQVGIFHVSIPSSGLTVPGTEALTFPPGTTRAKVLSFLTTLGGWLPPYFDNQGVCVIRSPPNPDGEPDHVYTDKRIAYATPIENEDMLSAPNTFVVIGTGPSKGELYAKVRVSASLPFSVENRGVEVVDVFRAQGMTSSDHALQIARARAYAGSLGFKNVNFDGPVDPRHDLFQTIFYAPGVGPTPPPVKGGRDVTNDDTYLETSFGFQLAAGAKHSHTMTLGGFYG